MNKTVIAGIIGAVIIAGAGFYGGMTYAKSGMQSRGQFGSGQFMGRMGGAGTGGTSMRGAGGGFTAGQIISKDPSGITLKLQDGSTKIILVASSTQVMKPATGSLDDLSVGTMISVTGMTNSDGSITGQSIQIRPAGSMPFGGAPQMNQ